MFIETLKVMFGDMARFGKNIKDVIAQAPPAPLVSLMLWIGTVFLTRYIMESMSIDGLTIVLVSLLMLVIGAPVSLFVGDWYMSAKRRVGK